MLAPPLGHSAGTPVFDGHVHGTKEHSVSLSKYDIEAARVREPGTSHSFLVELVGSNKRVLDVGCDTGYLGEVLSALGNKVWGFEISEETAALARERLIDCAVGDLENTDLAEVFEPHSFDVVIFGDVLEHLRDPLSVLRSSRRLLAPGGSVLISTPNIAHGDVRLALLGGQFRYNKLGILDETHTRFFTFDSLVSFAADAGFVVADLRRTRAELFTTEIGVTESDWDPDLVRRLRADPEATTYQFVARFIPDDATTVTSAQAVEVDRLRTEVQRLSAALATAEASVAELSEAKTTLQARVEEVQRAHDQAVAERDQSRIEAKAARTRLSTSEDRVRGVLSRARRAVGG
jgi:2-polyprenyl-3-methyl-5-hydroxy-6-metoxy-1,4-benzoquinol methylase